MIYLISFIYSLICGITFGTFYILSLIAVKKIFGIEACNVPKKDVFLYSSLTMFLIKFLGFL